MNYITTLKGVDKKGAKLRNSGKQCFNCFKTKDKRAVHEQCSLVGNLFLTEGLRNVKLLS